MLGAEVFDLVVEKFNVIAELLLVAQTLRKCLGDEFADGLGRVARGDEGVGGEVGVGGGEFDAAETAGWLMAVVVAGRVAVVAVVDACVWGEETTATVVVGAVGRQSAFQFLDASLHLVAQTQVFLLDFSSFIHCINAPIHLQPLSSTIPPLNLQTLNVKR